MVYRIIFKIGIYLFVFLLGCFTIYSLMVKCFGFRPIIVTFNSYKYNKINFKTGELIEPFKDFDFNSGNWKVYVNISSYDFIDLHNSIPRKRCFELTDKNILNEMKTCLRFVYKDADVATVSSSISVYKDNIEVFESGIVLDQNSEGLQSPEFGWVVPLQKGCLTNNMKNFKQVNWPIILLY